MGLCYENWVMNECGYFSIKCMNVGIFYTIQMVCVSTWIFGNQNCAQVMFIWLCIVSPLNGMFCCANWARLGELST